MTESWVSNWLINFLIFLVICALVLAIFNMVGRLGGAMVSRKTVLMITCAYMVGIFIATYLFFTYFWLPALNIEPEVIYLCPEGQVCEEDGRIAPMGDEATTTKGEN